MLTITEYSVEQAKDPFGILSGRRYEFMLDVDVPEDDELHSDDGVTIRVVFAVEDDRTRIAAYDVLERTTGRPLDVDLEDDELEAIAAFCRERYAEAED